MSKYLVEVSNPLTKEVFKGTKGVSLRLDESVCFNYLYTLDEKHIVEVTKYSYPTAILSHFMTIDEVIAFLGTFKHLYIMNPDIESCLREPDKFYVFDISTGDDLLSVKPMFLPYEKSVTSPNLDNLKRGYNLAFAKALDWKDAQSRLRNSEVHVIDTESAHPSFRFAHETFMGYTIEDSNLTQLILFPEISNGVTSEK